MIKSFKQFINEDADEPGYGIADWSLIDNVDDFIEDLDRSNKKPGYGVSEWIKDNVGKGDGGKNYMIVTDYDEIEKALKNKQDGKSRNDWESRKSITHGHYGTHRHLWMDEVLPIKNRDRDITKYIDASTLDRHKIAYMYDHHNVMNIYCIYNIGSLDGHLLGVLLDNMEEDKLNVSVLLVTDTEFHDLVNKVPHIPHILNGAAKI